MKIDAEETMFITYREDIKALYNKWKTIFDMVGYENIPIAVGNSSISLKDALTSVDYTIKCEQNNMENNRNE
jgi:hypothetical protein